MEVFEKNMSGLFDQLGLASDSQSITHFIENHTLAGSDDILDAQFWNSAQRQFLAQAKDQDADWAVTVDKLDSLLRK